MPELPEVELVTKSLQQLVAGRKIVAAELLRARLAPDHSAEEFASFVAPTAIERLTRRGKHILIELSNGRTLIVHLRMSGRFMLLPLEREFPKYTHAVFHLEDDLRLIFQDQRHFGMMKVVRREEVATTKEIAKLAPEPFSDDFSLAYFRSVLQQSGRSLKELLLDQTKVLGLGNIYASEAMFLARVNPRKRANQISKLKTSALYEAAKFVLAESISHGSTLNVDPENIDGSYYGGGYEERWRVYDRENEPCIDCQKPIKRIVQGGRSTYFCPSCQR